MEDKHHIPIGYAILSFITLSVCLDTAIYNGLLLAYCPQLFPKLEKGVTLYEVIFEGIMLNVASLFLITHRNEIKNVRWWMAFSVTIVPYIVLKSVGVYGDSVLYDIAEFHGRKIGGGASMAHVYVIAFAFSGMPYLFSLIGYQIGKNFGDMETQYLNSN